MKTRFQLGSLFVLGVACLGVGAFAQKEITRNAAQRPGNNAKSKSSKQSLEEYLVRKKVIGHIKERQALWAALVKAWPQTFGKDTVHAGFDGKPLVDLQICAENSSLTEICFYRQGEICTFDARTKKISPVVMQLVLPPINEITYTVSTSSEGSNFILWSSGRPVACIGD